jgi:hypothetical protein
MHANVRRAAGLIRCSDPLPARDAHLETAEGVVIICKGVLGEPPGVGGDTGTLFLDRAVEASVRTAVSGLCYPNAILFNWLISPLQY